MKIPQLAVSILAALVALASEGCQRQDAAPLSDFYIDLNTGNVTDHYGVYEMNVPDYTNLYITGGYVYVLGVIIFKGLDQNYYALSQYHATDGCTVEYQVFYDELVCPCDQYHFNKSGEESFGSGTSYLTPFMTSLSNSILHVYSP